MKLLVRADAGFATPELYHLCEAERVESVIGLQPNESLSALSAPLANQAEEALARGDEGAPVLGPQFDRLRLRLLKIGARVVTARRTWLHRAPARRARPARRAGVREWFGLARG